MKVIKIKLKLNCFYSFNFLLFFQVETSIRAIATFHARTLELPRSLVEQFQLRAPVHIRVGFTDPDRSYQD